MPRSWVRGKLAKKFAERHVIPHPKFFAQSGFSSRRTRFMRAGQIGSVTLSFSDRCRGRGLPASAPVVPALFAVYANPTFGSLFVGE